MWLPERMLDTILQTVDQVTLSLKEKERQENYQTIYDVAQQARGLHNRFLMHCRSCADWCKRKRKKPILWPMSYQGLCCPLCNEFELKRASIL